MRASPCFLLLWFVASTAFADMTSDEAACAAGDPRYCNNLGVAWSEGKDGASRVDHAKAKSFYEKACNLNNGLGCFNLGNVYRVGEGLNPDHHVAAVHFKRSCDLDEAKGCTELAILHYEGTGVERDVSRTMELLEKACRLGSAVACKNAELVKAAHGK